MKTIATDAEQLISEEALTRGLAARPDCIPGNEHRAIVERVCNLFQAMKRDQTGAPSLYQPGGEWAHYLAERQEFYDRLQIGDVEFCEDRLKNFWRNELGPIVKEYAKYEQLVRNELEFVQRFQSNVTRNYLIWKEIHDGRIEMLDTPMVGNPWGYEIEGRLVLPKATRFHALSQQLRGLTQDVESPLVAEIGGGYGGVAYYFLRDRADATYVDFDLPETLVIAAYYLLCTLADRDIFLYGEGQTPQGEALKDYSAVLLPNFELPNIADTCVDVFFNSFSFSEVPMDSLTEYMWQVQRVVKDYFLHNNMDRKGVLNRGFERIPASEYPIDHSAFKRLYKQFDLFHGREGDYREFLYQKVARVAAKAT